MATEAKPAATEDAKMDLFEDDDEFEEFEIDRVSTACSEPEYTRSPTWFLDGESAEESDAAVLLRGAKFIFGKGVSEERKKATRALKALKSLHDFVSVVIEQLLGHVRERYSIPTDYELHVPRPW
ncbi:hypothetical protein BHE74_00038176 [Ensete ventricosum]|nr:hypothetical protein GW17_00016415 [Ensete ventricosum]RWW55200.1 hypothetical protein BHE74_00038176 [Ensete ventricosum]RZS14305.1 hypothetical protein BHM03_00045981 [Ensete ventricosum]